MRWLLLALLLACMLLGCKSRPLGPYVSPRVTGQVVAVDTHLPLRGVSVTRGRTDQRASMVSPPKGAELLMRKAPAQTDRDGRFVLPSERVLSVIRGAGWNTVSLSFDQSGYWHFETNCPISAATDSAGGEPVLDVGQIFLSPVGRP
jgi:hypothetical protein